MALNNSRQSIIDNRRREVARLRLMQLSQREIVDALEKAGIINPETGKPFALGTINADLQELQAEWRKQAMEDTRSQRGRVLAEIQELRRRAWAKDDLSLVLRGLAQETTVAGLQRPAAPEDLIHYDTRHVKIESKASERLRKMLSAVHAPNVTPDEKATLEKLFADWHRYAQMLLERSEEGLELLAKVAVQEQEEELEQMESPADEDLEDEED